MNRNTGIIETHIGERKWERSKDGVYPSYQRLSSLIFPCRIRLCGLDPRSDHGRFGDCDNLGISFLCIARNSLFLFPIFSFISHLQFQVSVMV
jgi:hypothetical protein